MKATRNRAQPTPPAGHQLEVEDVRRVLSDSDSEAIKERIDRAERTLEDLKSLLAHAPLLRNGKLSTGTIDYAAFRVETLSLIFETAQHTFRKFAETSDLAYEQFLSDLGDEVGLTFARDLLNRLIKHNLLLPFQDMRKLLELWASFENDTGAGETKITHYDPERITIRLSNNPLRRAETTAHAHCGFYRSYLGSLVNEIFALRARHIRKRVEGADVKAQNVVEVAEHPDADDQCVFTLRCRRERLTRSFDLLTESYQLFFQLAAHDDFASCMNKARAALVSAQLEAIGLSVERAPKQLHKVFKPFLSADIFKRMDDSYHRVSKTLHGEAKSGQKVERKYAWGLLRDVRRCVYALELLEMDEAKASGLKGQAVKLDQLATIEELAEKARDLSLKDKHELKELLSQIKEGAPLSEERQITLVSMLRKVGTKAWEVARPVLSEILTTAIKEQLDVGRSQ